MSAKVDTHEYAELARKAKIAAAAIDSDMREGLRESARIGARTAKLMIHAWPATGGHGRTRIHRGLRSRLASQISVDTHAHSAVIVQSARGIRGQASRDLPRGIDRGAWVHPVYGHRVKVLQTGWPYFDKPIQARQPEMERVMEEKVLNKIERRLK